MARGKFMELNTRAAGYYEAIDDLERYLGIYSSSNSMPI